MGKIEGEVNGPAIEVTETGVLAGKAKVSELRSRGELAGEFDADEVELAGRVRDDTIIRARSLLVARSDGEPTALFGECEIQVGDAPARRRRSARPWPAAGARPPPPRPPSRPPRQQQPPPLRPSPSPPRTPAPKPRPPARAAAAGRPPIAPPKAPSPREDSPVRGTPGAAPSLRNPEFTGI
jgi:hypothetical protein